MLHRISTILLPLETLKALYFFHICSQTPGNAYMYTFISPFYWFMTQTLSWKPFFCFAESGLSEKSNWGIRYQFSCVHLDLFCFGIQELLRPISSDSENIPRTLLIKHQMDFFLSALTSLWGSPAAEKMGIFCPLAMLFIPSMAEMPVWIISSG